MKKVFYIALTICMAVFVSCTQQKGGPSEQEIQDRIDAAVKDALAEQASTASASVTSSSFSSDYSSASDSYTSSSSSESKPNSSSPVGEYRFSDDYNNYTLTINADETSQIVGNGQTYYGSWSEWCGIAYWVQNSESLYLFVNGKKQYCSPMIDLSLEWLYLDSSPLKAKDPNKRVKLTRVK
ncbi:MAG: hypothetical protein KBT12_07900 [Bacteroidales bacterium]|nr:hypothetical protein [Candidatus Physcousia equi]